MGLLVPAITVLLWSTADSFDGGLSLVLVFPVLDLLALWLVAMVVAVVATACGRAWWHTTLLFGALLAAAPAGRLCLGAGDTIHLLVMLPTYTQEVDTVRQTRFAWGGHGLVAGGSWRTVVHDPTDRILTESVEPQFYGTRDDVSVRRLIGHYYVVDEPA